MNLLTNNVTCLKKVVPAGLRHPPAQIEATDPTKPLPLQNRYTLFLNSAIEISQPGFSRSSPVTLSSDAPDCAGEGLPMAGVHRNQYPKSALCCAHCNAVRQTGQSPGKVLNHGSAIGERELCAGGLEMPAGDRQQVWVEETKGLSTLRVSTARSASPAVPRRGTSKWPYPDGGKGGAMGTFLKCGKM